MQKTWKLAALSGALLLGLQSAGSAAILAQYSFGVAGQETTLETSPAYAPTTVASGLTATSVTDPANAVVLEITSTGTPANAPFLRLGPATGATTAATAVTTNSYFQLTLQATVGSLLDLDSLTFNVTRGGASARGYIVRSSLDNFTANLGAADITTTRPTYTPVSIDLNSFPLLSDQTAVTFRFYSYSPGPGSTVEYDDIIFNGSVAAIPEPSLLLGGCGIAGLVLLRRARRSE